MFQKRLQEIRTNHKISQKELAQSLQVSQQTIAKWENGKATPNPNMIAKIANYFNISSDYLLGLSSIPSPKEEETFLKISQNKDLLLLCRKVQNAPEEKREQITDMLKESVHNYLTLIGIEDTEDETNQS
jgi:transcriptional regulator with XRE-family HTH domain